MKNIKIKSIEEARAELHKGTGAALRKSWPT